MMSPDVISWRELRLFSAYRLFLATTLFVVFYFNFSPSFLGRDKPEYYGLISIAYLFVSLFFIGVTIKKIGGFITNVWMQLTTDIIFITLIINTSGGLQSGLGALLIVVVVAGG